MALIPELRRRQRELLLWAVGFFLVCVTSVSAMAEGLLPQSVAFAGLAAATLAFLFRAAMLGAFCPFCRRPGFRLVARAACPACGAAFQAGPPDPSHFGADRPRLVTWLCWAQFVALPATLALAALGTLSKPSPDAALAVRMALEVGLMLLGVFGLWRLSTWGLVLLIALSFGAFTNGFTGWTAIHVLLLADLAAYGWLYLRQPHDPVEKAFGVAPAALILVLFAFPDGPAPDDGALRPAAPGAVADERNAYNDLGRMKARVQLSEPERQLINKEAQSDAPELAAVAPLLARNAELMTMLDGFSRRDSFADPAGYSLDVPVPQFYPVVFAAKLRSLRAAELLERGRAPEALEEALVVVDAGRLMLRSDAGLIGTLVGYLVTDIGARRARLVIERGDLDKARLLDAARRLSAASDGVAALQSGLRFEYVAMVRVLERLAEAPAELGSARLLAGPARMGYLYQPRSTRALFAERFHDAILEAAKPCREARLPPLGPPRAPLLPNAIGRVLLRIALPQYDKLYVRRCESAAGASATAAAAALKAYRLERGRYPDALRALVPDYLAAEPLDPFTGAALLYSPETGEVRSAGGA